MESNFNKHVCNNFLNSITLSCLSNDDSVKLDGLVTLQECEAAVRTCINIKSRLATDNVRRLLHIIDGTQSSPAAVLSLDAMKAFDHQWPFFMVSA